jgi:hypothetical protein
MATEYTWHGDVDVDTPSLRAFIAAATAGEQHEDGTVFLHGMYVMASHVQPEDANPAMSLFGFEDRFRATFRLSPPVDEQTTWHVEALMAHTVIAFAAKAGGNGVLLFNGEQAVIQYVGGVVVFDADWEWDENPETAPLLSQFPSRILPQPLL